MGAELARKREGKKTRTGMTENQLEDFASKRSYRRGRFNASAEKGKKSTKGSKPFTGEELKQGFRRCQEK
jgi:hypothetical protein